jgi:hypothetical protein
MASVGNRPLCTVGNYVQVPADLQRLPALKPVALYIVFAFERSATFSGHCASGDCRSWVSPVENVRVCVAKLTYTWNLMMKPFYADVVAAWR